MHYRIFAINNICTFVSCHITQNKMPTAFPPLLQEWLIWHRGTQLPHLIYIIQHFEKLTSKHQFTSTEQTRTILFQFPVSPLYFYQLCHKNRLNHWRNTEMLTKEQNVSLRRNEKLCDLHNREIHITGMSKYKDCWWRNNLDLVY